MPHENFFQRIEAFNRMYKMTDIPQDDPVKMLHRLEQFGRMLGEEAEEGDEILQALLTGDAATARIMLADWLGDMIVYCASEGRRWGLPMEAVLDIIMDSNASKLQPDGTALFVDGKLQKGPGYWKPEPKIKALLSDVKGTPV